MRVGFIGTGSMGSILIEAFIQSGALNPVHMIITNRTMTKAERLAAEYPGLQVARSSRDVVNNSDIIFLCIKPSEYKTVIDDIKKEASPAQILVSITSPVQISHLEAVLQSKIAKIIPSITNYVFSGATLCAYSTRMTDEDIELLENMVSHISAPIRISEQYTRICSDLSSCGPAFLAFFIQKFIDAAVEETGIPESLAIQLASEMVLGTGKLLTTGGLNPVTLQQRVSVPGGITAAGIRIMENELHGLFNNLIRTTHSKYKEELEKAASRFNGTKIE
jgi:competence protein ComER